MRVDVPSSRGAGACVPASVPDGGVDVEVAPHDGSCLLDRRCGPFVVACAVVGVNEGSGRAVGRPGGEPVHGCRTPAWWAPVTSTSTTSARWARGCCRLSR